MNTMRILVVGGRFDSNGGKKSGYIEKLFSGIKIPDALWSTIYNGGDYKFLTNDLFNRIQNYDIIFWFPDIPNDMPKAINNIKSLLNPHCILITSKNNIEGKYSFLELVNKALNARANLFVEFTKKQDLFQGKVFDPLGNQFNTDTSIAGVRSALEKRITQLLTYTRSASTGAPGDITAELPNESRFLEIVKEHASNLHIHSHTETVEPTRFVGNLSFRCLHGFPSYRADSNLIFVSRRNIDKRSIAIDNMVPVIPGKISPIEYLGYRKPSVDAPIQVMLYAIYSKMRYAFHAHAYLDGAPFSKEIIPCGSLEEVNEIVQLFPDPNITTLAVNLKGHGCLIMSSSVLEMENLKFIPRILPELATNSQNNPNSLLTSEPESQTILM